jgi:hypothetical protein
MVAKADVKPLTPRQREGRAVNAVAQLLRRTLSVPNIYIDPPGSTIAADVLAVDHGGAGDLHAVEIKLEKDLAAEALCARPSNPNEHNQMYAEWYARYRQKLATIHRQLMSMPAHFRYLAIPADGFDLASGELGRLGLFPADGIGRLGVITIHEKGEISPTAEIAIAPERFRLDPAKLRAIETRILARSRPDIEVRI